MEAVAEAGRGAVSPATAAQLDPGVLGAAESHGRPTSGRPPEAQRAVPRARGRRRRRDHRACPADRPARPVCSAVANRRNTGTPPSPSSILAVSTLCTRSPGARGPDGGAGADRVGAEAAADRHGRGLPLRRHRRSDGGKVLLTGGVPVCEAMTSSVAAGHPRAVVRAPPVSTPARSGLNDGRFFVTRRRHPYRRIHSFSGDAINLAARVMGRAADGQVLATAASWPASEAALVTERLHRSW